MLANLLNDSDLTFNGGLALALLEAYALANYDFPTSAVAVG